MADLKGKMAHIKNVIYKAGNTVLLVLPLLLMDIYVRMLAGRINYSRAEMYFPSIMFSVVWISAIVLVSVFSGSKLGRVMYLSVFLIFFAFFLTHSVYFNYTGFFFNFNLLESAEEGSAYILDTVKNTGYVTYIICIAVLISGIVAFFMFPKGKKIKIKSLIITIVSFVVAISLLPITFGKKNTSLEWDTWRNPGNVYENFSDSNKCMKICGIFQYTARDFYTSFIRSDNEVDDGDIEFLESEYASLTEHETNPYTGIFKDKNVIFLQLEGIDSWLFNEKNMPNLYGMLENSIVFDNHYSYYTGGGSTFNSELAAITGFITPITYLKNPYSFNTNYYPGSLPRLLKNEGYTANAFHMNTGEYYSRELNYLNWGFDNYFSLMDDGGYTDKSYELDTELVQNSVFYEKLFKGNQPFVHYLITFTPHTPFSSDSKTAKMIAERQGMDKTELDEMDEELVAEFFASETDRMIGLLIEALEENGLAENTVIVAYADHYLYTLNDKSILDKYKTTNNNLINHTPFFIWSKGQEEQHIQKVNSQIDILPTVLNMLGVDYYNEYYIGKDIMNEDYNGFVFFSDYSWYDGNIYVENGTAGGSSDNEYVNDMNEQINNCIKRNDLTLKYDYFRKLK